VVSVRGPVKIKKLVAKGLPVAVTCNAPCDLVIRLLIDPPVARRLRLAAHGGPVEVGRGRGRLGRPGTITVSVKLSAKAAKRLRRSKGITATVSTAAVDTAGNQKLTSKRIKLKR
jgi:hypothetical protein